MWDSAYARLAAKVLADEDEGEERPSSEDRARMVAALEAAVRESARRARRRRVVIAIVIVSVLALVALSLWRALEG